jgi:hypothetical protein
LRSAANEAPAASTAADASKRIKREGRICFPLRCRGIKALFHRRGNGHAVLPPNSGRSRNTRW